MSANTQFLFEVMDVLELDSDDDDCTDSANILKTTEFYTLKG